MQQVLYRAVGHSPSLMYYWFQLEFFLKQLDQALKTNAKKQVLINITH